jgi:hypothetical protein
MDAEPDVEESADDEEEPGSADEWSEEEDPFDDLATEEDPAHDAQVASCAALMLDWMGQIKATWVSAEDVWDMLQSVCGGRPFPVFRKVKKMVKDYLNRRMERVDMCPKGCVAYINCEHPRLQGPEWQNASADKCPVCTSPRWLPRVLRPDGTFSPARAVKEFFYQPVKHWFQDMYRRADIVPHLRNNLPGRPGAVRRSHGYQNKVVNNPVLNQDVRNLGIVGSHDGVPCFKNINGCRGVVPVMLRTCMDERLGLNVRNCHMVALVPDQHWTIDPNTGRARRIRKKTTTLRGVLAVLVDELLALYDTGVPIIDYSLPEGHASRHFMLRAILLYWIADYPGLAEAAGTMAERCHWCHQKFVWHCSIKRATHCDFCPFLPPGDQSRTEDTAPTPTTRTNEGMLRDAEASEAFPGPPGHADHPRWHSGVSAICPLAYLHLWDMVWDFLPDFMHINEGYFKSHMLPLLKGERFPTAPILTGNPTKSRRILT